MLRNKKRALLILIFLCLTGALWALKIELMYEHNISHGIPADFRAHHRHTVYNWRA